MTLLQVHVTGAKSCEVPYEKQISFQKHSLKCKTDLSQSLVFKQKRADLYLVFQINDWEANIPVASEGHRDPRLYQFMWMTTPQAQSSPSEAGCGHCIGRAISSTEGDDEGRLHDPQIPPNGGAQAGGFRLRDAARAFRNCHIPHEGCTRARFVWPAPGAGDFCDVSLSRCRALGAEAAGRTLSEIPRSNLLRPIREL